MGFKRIAMGVLVVAVSLGCRAKEAPPPLPPPEPPPAAPPGNPLTWSITSFGGQATLSQTSLSDTCSLECTRAGQQVWRRPLCLGRSGDFAFISDDCASGVLFLEYPLRGTPVVLVLNAAGAATPFTLEQVMREPARTRGEGRRIRWLAGVVGEPGVKPHLSAGGDAVEFTTLEGVPRSARLSHLEDLRLREPAAQVAGPGGAGLYQFTDDEGSTQFVMGLDQVPARFRKRATPVEAQISAVRSAPLPPRAATFAPKGSEVAFPTTVLLSPRADPEPRAEPALPGQPGSGAIITCPFGLNVFGGCGGALAPRDFRSR